MVESSWYQRLVGCFLELLGLLDKLDESEKVNAMARRLEDTVFHEPFWVAADYDPKLRYHVEKLPPLKIRRVCNSRTCAKRGKGPTSVAGMKVGQATAAYGEIGWAANHNVGPIRLRPILMTTLAMIFGMVPVALGLDAGSEMRVSMAITVFGGLFTSTVLTLVVVPVAYTVVDDLSRRPRPMAEPSP